MNIAKIRSAGQDFQLLQTTGRTQTASITLKGGQATSDDLNTHPHSDQTVVMLEGELLVDVGHERNVPLRTGESLIIPAGVGHRLHNGAEKTAFAFTVYAPPAYQTDDPT